MQLKDWVYQVQCGATIIATTGRDCPATHQFKRGKLSVPSDRWMLLCRLRLQGVGYLKPAQQQQQQQHRQQYIHTNRWTAASEQLCGWHDDH